tara:strand:+ start:549 stop:878 length:330 start_codon:yes stop_codon:yes gene_type:complete
VRERHQLGKDADALEVVRRGKPSITARLVNGGSQSWCSSAALPTGGGVSNELIVPCPSVGAAQVDKRGDELVGGGDARVAANVLGEHAREALPLRARLARRAANANRIL